MCVNLIDFKDIALSKYDLKRGLKFPTTINSDLAEEIGIHVGDGCLCHYINNKGFSGYKYIVTSGGDEKEYVEQHIIPLLKRVYGIIAALRLKKDGTIQTEFESKNLAQIKMRLGLPLGKKDNIGIPASVINSDFTVDFLRGLMDTDGGLCFLKKNRKIHYYPRLAITSKSKKLILQINSILCKYSFKTSLSLDSRELASNGVLCTTSRVTMNGKDNLQRWIKLIGFSNPKNIRKLEEWNWNGFVENKKNATGGI